MKAFAAARREERRGWGPEPSLSAPRDSSAAARGATG